MINIGLVGLGGMGTVHKSNYEHIEGVRVKACVGTTDKDTEKAKEWQIPIYSSIKEMVENEEIDAVDVTTPTFLHKTHVMEALNLGKNVICEKPLALNVKDGKAMFDKAEEKGLNIYVGQVLRFFPEYKVLSEVVKSGEYGKVLDGYFVRLSARPRWNQGGWMFEKEKSGLVPFDLHIHDLDFIVSLFGVPKEFSYTASGNENEAFKEHYRFTYKFAELSVCAEAAWFNAEYPWTAEYRVYFENAVMESKGGVVTSYQFDKEPRVFDTEEKIKIPTGINVPPTGVYLDELTHFIDCIKENKKSDIVTKEQVLTVLALLEEIGK